MRKEKILRSIRRDGLGIEIGPSHNPLAPKREGFQVHIIDHLSREKLVEKYTSHNVNLDNIEEVDFIWNGESYVELIGKAKHYDWIISSHTIEHAPDLIGFLNNCADVLKDDGVISLAIPDKRYCFDHFRPISGLGSVVDAHFQKKTIHSPGLIAEYFLNVVAKGDHIAWHAAHEGDYRLIHTLDEAKAHMALVTQQQSYVDVHAWCFVPSSFRLLIHDLFSLGLISLKEADFLPTEGCEFYVNLSKSGPGVQSSRLELLAAITHEVALPAVVVQRAHAEVVAPQDALQPVAC